VSEIFQKKKSTPKSALKLSRAQKTMEQVLLSCIVLDVVVVVVAVNVVLDLLPSPRS